jgi:drug/metabolite transporter (DMT)-like permease
MTLHGKQAKGYVMVGGAALMFGSTGVFVRLTDMPVSMLLSLRMLLAAVLVALVFVSRHWWREMVKPGVLRRLVVLGVLDAVQMYAFFVALRYMDVALAVFLSYMSPIYIAILAPRLLKQQTERAVVAALLLALAGIALMLLPGLLVPDLRVSAVGVAAGLVAGLALAFFFLVAKDLCAHVGGDTLLIWNGVFVGLVMLPVGLVQTLGGGYRFVLSDLWVVLGLAVFGTALGGTIFLQGMHYIRVQHTSIVGLLEPVSVPLYALVFLGERTDVWTLAGGGLILAAAVLVVLFGKSEEGLAGSPEEALAEAEALP